MIVFTELLSIVHTCIVEGGKIFQINVISHVFLYYYYGNRQTKNIYHLPNYDAYMEYGSIVFFGSNLFDTEYSLTLMGYTLLLQLYSWSLESCF